MGQKAFERAKHRGRRRRVQIIDQRCFVMVGILILVCLSFSCYSLNIEQWAEERTWRAEDTRRKRTGGTTSGRLINRPASGNTLT